MDNNNAKAQAFLSRLMQNPTMNGFSALQREDQLMQFFAINGQKLKPTLTSDAFFPGESWQNIYKLMTQNLYDMTNKEIRPQIQSELNDRISYSFVSFLNLPAPSESMKRQLMAVIDRLLNNPFGRQELTGPLNAIRSGIMKKYIMYAFERQKYIHFELSKVQRLRMSQEEVYNYIKTSLLIKPLAYLFQPGGPGQNQVHGLTPGFAEQITRQLSKLIPDMPDTVIRSSINSCIAFQDNNKLEATARLAAIFSSRCAVMKEGMKIDRGAASSDQSWFNIARRNHKFYGYDFDMLTELYNISAENGW